MFSQSLIIKAVLTRHLPSLWESVLPSRANVSIQHIWWGGLVTTGGAQHQVDAGGAGVASCGGAGHLRYRIVFWLKNYMKIKFSGNLLSIYIMSKNELDFKISFVRLVIILCIFDSFCILFNITIFSLPLINETYRHQVQFKRVHILLVQELF